MQYNQGYFDDLLVSAPVSNLVYAAAQEVASIARSTAHVITGEYRDGIVVKKKYQRRVVGIVQATARHSLAYEARYGHLARAVKEAGLTRRRRERGGL